MLPDVPASQSRLESYFKVITIRRVDKNEVVCLNSDDDAPLVQRPSNAIADAPLAQDQSAADESEDHIDDAAAASPGVAPNVVSRSRDHYQVTSASDSRAKRSKFEEEAEECSDYDEDDGDEDDSFICSDHDSNADDRGSNADGPDLRAICDGLRNRRGFVVNNLQCPQCYRLRLAISRFAAEVHAAVPE
jgi:hypothetical protein